MPRARSPWLAVALVVVLAAACSGSSKGKAHSTTTATNRRPTVPLRAPTGDLYQPPAHLRSAAPGTLIWARVYAQLASAPLFPRATVWQMLYHSRDRAGHDIAVSGFAVVPTGRAPADGRPVFAWAHPLVGLADACAPSKAIRKNVPPYGTAQVARGAILVATDYEGLGTPGAHPYLVGVAEGRDVLDSIRAAASLPNANGATNVVIAGESEGGDAALWAAQIAHSYAPELHVRGVVALAPTAELSTLAAPTATSSKYLGLAVLAAAGLQSGYSTFAPRTYLTPAATADLTRVRTECAGATIARYRGRSVKSVFSRNPNSVRALHAILVANSPGASNPRVPILLLQGALDQQIPAALTAQLHSRYCALHATVTRIVYRRTAHDGLVAAASRDASKWINDRYRGEPAHADCS